MLQAMSIDATTPATRLWLAHHHAHETERCVTVRGRHVCRRCSVLYPAALAALALSLLGLHWPAGADGLLLWVLPAPAVAEFIGEHLGRLSHDSRRLRWLTLLAAPALGRGFARYLEHPGDRLWWNVVATYVLLGVAAVVAAQWRRAEAKAAAVYPRYELMPSDPSSSAASTTSSGAASSPVSVSAASPASASPSAPASASASSSSAGPM
jgi:hypothetical protein